MNGSTEFTVTSGKTKAVFAVCFSPKADRIEQTSLFKGCITILDIFYNMADAIQARLDAEAIMHDGYIAAYDTYLKRAEKDPKWAEQNPFYYKVSRVDDTFQVATNGKKKNAS